MARVRVAEGDLDGGLTLLDEADGVYNGDYSPNVRPVPAVRARLWIRRSELAHAREWARQRELAPDDDLSYLREFEHVTLARLLLAEHAADREQATLRSATGLLDRLLRAAEEGGRGGTALEVLVLLARAHQQRGDVAKALESLGHAVVRAEPEGYVRLFRDEGPAVAELLTRLAKAQGSAYVRRLAAASTDGPARQAQASLVSPLSTRELVVLRLLGSDLSGPDIARELSVSLNTLRTHTKSIYAKLGVDSRRAAVRRAAELDVATRGVDG
jgi:LuxR family maltose regulon positive regulatory protein